jgi:hypothetical protein
MCQVDIGEGKRFQDVAQAQACEGDNLPFAIYFSTEHKIEYHEVADLSHICISFKHIIEDKDEQFRLPLQLFRFPLADILLILDLVFEPKLTVDHIGQIYNLLEMLGLTTVDVKQMLYRFLGCFVLLCHEKDKILDVHVLWGILKLVLQVLQQTVTRTLRLHRLVEVVVVLVVEKTERVITGSLVTVKTDLLLSQLHLATAAVPAVRVDDVNVVLGVLSNEKFEVVSLVLLFIFIQEVFKGLDSFDLSVRLSVGREKPFFGFLEGPFFRGGHQWQSRLLPWFLGVHHHGHHELVQVCQVSFLFILRFELFNLHRMLWINHL